VPASRGGGGAGGNPHSEVVEAKAGSRASAEEKDEKEGTGTEQHEEEEEGARRGQEWGGVAKIEGESACQSAGEQDNKGHAAGGGPPAEAPMDMAEDKKRDEARGRGAGRRRGLTLAPVPTTKRGRASSALDRPSSGTSSRVASGEAEPVGEGERAKRARRRPRAK